MGREISNKQIILKDYVKRFPKESDMILKSSILKLEVPDGCSDAVLVKNLYLSCDPYMRNRMSQTEGSYIDSFTPGSVSIFLIFSMTYLIAFSDLQFCHRLEKMYILASTLFFFLAQMRGTFVILEKFHVSAHIYM